MVETSRLDHTTPMLEDNANDNMRSGDPMVLPS